MQEFKSYHPIVNFAYFLAVLGFSMVFMHPIALVTSFMSGFVYSVMLKGKKGLKSDLLMLPFVLAVAVINPIFNHHGMTILAYLTSGNPITLESVIYGISAGVMLMCVVCHFSCFNEIMTSDKLMCLFGRIIPSLSLTFSMVLRFVPKFTTQVKAVRNAQRCVGRDLSQGNILQRIKNGVKILSIMATWCLENGIDTADSMKSRGFGLSNRSSHSNFKLTDRDIYVLLCIIVLSTYIIAGSCIGAMHLNFFPKIKAAELSPYNISVFAAYLILHISPIIIELNGVARWKKLKSKI